MRRQFLYGRKNAGYCQLNEDYFGTDRNDLMQLETLQNYTLADGVNLGDLPLEYYVYADEISGERVWIEGLTSFVPGGTSTESGSRDTSMIHKYIYSEEDYEKHIWAEKETEMRRFFRTVDDYQQGEGEDIESQWDAVDFSALQEKFGFDQEQLADFIVCCLDSFPNPEKRVYCYLPSADREGSMYAKSLMEALLNAFPPCVNVVAGFITYSSTFHNASINPIPGNISVIFIPDTFENRQREVAERNKSYIFDFKNYEKQNKLKSYEYVSNLINAVIDDMKLGCKKETISTYDELINFVKYNAAVGVDFLTYFCVHKQLKVLFKKEENISEKLCRTMASTIGKLLEFEETLTDAGRLEITREVEKLMQHCRYSETELEWVDRIYKSGELCRKKIIYYLCDACLRFIGSSPHDQNNEILMITNYEYTDIDLNDYILSTIYSKEEYFPVGQRLIFETLKPLKNDSDKTPAKKRALLFSSVSGLYKAYPEFVTSNYFTKEIVAFLIDFMHKADDMLEELTAVIDAVEQMDKPFQEAYYPVLQELCYLVVQTFVSDAPHRHTEKSKLEYCKDLVLKYDLAEYEEEIEVEASCVQALKKMMREGQLSSAIASKDVKEVLQVFSQFPFEEVVTFCGKNYREVEKYFWLCMFGEGKDDFSDWKELFLYFCCGWDASVLEQSLSIIIKRENLAGLMHFYEDLQEKITVGECEKKKKVFYKVMEQHRDLWHGRAMSGAERRFLAEMEGREIPGYNNRMLYVDEKDTISYKKENDHPETKSGHRQREEGFKDNGHEDDDLSDYSKDHSEDFDREDYEEEDGNENKRNLFERMKSKLASKKN